MLKDNELIGKYIKYSPEISEEVFDKIINRLKAANFKSFGSNNDFKGFKKYGYLSIFEDLDFQITTNETGENEISYKDIIGEEEWWKDLKKGDYVVCIKDNLSAATKNFIYEVNYVDSDNWISHEQENGISNGYRYNNYRLATLDEIAMYIHAGNKPVDVTTYKLPLAQESLKSNKIDGEYYYSKFNYDNKWGEIIVKWCTNIDKNQFISLHNKYYKQDSCCTALTDTSIGEVFRLATVEEKQWLDLCIQENKFIPKEDVAKYLKPKFEVGKWYRYNSAVLLKYLETIGEYFVCSERIVDGNYNVIRSKYLLEPITNASLEEIQQYLPAGHPDKIIKDSSWCVQVTEENKEVIKKYIDDNSYCYTVGAYYGIFSNGNKGGNALSTKFGKVISTEEFYKKIGHSVESIKSFQVHDKCNIGDIIVSLEPKCNTIRKDGDLHKVLEKSTYTNLYYNEYGSIETRNKTTYRLANAQEIELFNKGIKNIYDVKEEEFVLPEKWCIKSTPETGILIAEFYDKIAKTSGCYEDGLINCNYENKYFYSHNLASEDSLFGNNPGANFISDTKDKNYTEITFEKFKKYVLYSKLKTESKKNNMEEILLEAKRKFPIGCRFYPILEDGTLSNMIYTQSRECYIFDDEWIIGSANIRNAMGDWAKVISSPEEKDLITIAKERYPIGTKFNPAHIDRRKDYCIVTNTNFVEDTSGNIVVLTDEERHWDGSSKYGNTTCNRVVYRKYTNKWATIVSSSQEEKTTNQPFKAGDKLVGKATNGDDITTKGNPLGEKGKYAIADKVEYDGNKVELWANGSYWPCYISDISLYQEKEESKLFSLATEDDYNWKVLFPTGIQVKSEQKYYCGVDPYYLPEKPELILKDENEPVIFPNIKRERIVEIKIKLVD